MKSWITLSFSIGLFLTITSCDQLFPPPIQPLVADAGEDTTAPADTTVTLTATATGGQPPYLYRWTLEDQPDSAEYSIPSDATTNSILEIEPLSIAGDYIFRIHVTDSLGTVARSYVTVDADGDTELTNKTIEITAESTKAIAKVGETAELSIVFEGLLDEEVPDDRTYSWSVNSGVAELDDSKIANPTITINKAETIQISVTFEAEDDETKYTGNADVYIVGIPEEDTAEVIIEVVSGNTGPGQIAGEVILELLPDQAPETCANFLRYVDDEFYDGLLWHRVVNDVSVQTGGYERSAGEITKKSGTRDEIDGESDTSIANGRATVAMALDGIGPDSATSQFFINLADNTDFDSDPAHTVFAKVTSGMDIIDQIGALEVDTESGFTNVPTEDILVSSIRRPTIVDLTAESDDPLVIVGESTTVRVSYDEDELPGTPSFAWKVVSGDATIANASSERTDVTINSSETVHLEVTVTAAGDSWTAKSTEDVYIVGILNATPRVVITNSGDVSGEIVIELLTEAAPNTCANFLRYVDDGFFDGIIWHRVVSGFVIQGGAYERVDGEMVKRDGARDPVASEANNGYSNTRGYIAMALQGEDADSGSNQFFINLDDNSSLDNGTPPFTVWAQVVSGMDVVDEIAAVDVHTDSGTSMTDVPVDDVVMETIRRQD